MSVPSVSASASASSAKAARPEFNNKLVIDWTQIPEYAGLKPNDVVNCVWGKDKGRPALDIDAFEASGAQLYGSKIEGSPAYSLTFKTAVGLVLDWIRNSMTDENGCVKLTYNKNGYCLHDELIVALSCADTPDYASLSAVPKGKFGKASEDHVNRLLGAIIHLLYDQKLIADYGQYDSFYWVQLKQVQEEGKRKN